MRPFQAVPAPFTGSLAAPVRAAPAVLSRRRFPCVRATADDKDGFDIDALAKRLSAEASKLGEEYRQSSDSSSGEDEPPSTSASDRGARQAPQRSAGAPGVFGIEDEAQQAAALANIGPPDFRACDFVIFQRLGSLQVQQAVAGDIDGSWSDSEAASVPAINAFAATFETGQPFQSPVTVLLKEFLPGSRAAGINELSLLSTIQPLPYESMRWQAASSDMADTAVVPALGWFRAPPSIDIPGVDPDAESLWVVYKWENLRPLVAYPTFKQSAPQAGGLPSGLSAMIGRKAPDPTIRRFRMLRAIIRGALRAVVAAHAQGVVHGSLGTGSIMVSALGDERAGSLVVKLDNLGFGQRFDVGTREDGDSPFSYARRIDCSGLGVAIAETVLGALTSSGPSAATETAAVQRLLVEVFSGDALAFRDYCLDVDDWAAVVKFLDESDLAGWNLLDGLLQGDQDCEALLESPFFAVDDW